MSLPAEVTAAEAHLALCQGGAFLLDVRGSDEFREAHASGAVNIPLALLGSRLADVPADRPVYVICLSGMRSASAAQWLRGQGRTNVVNVKGGTAAWHRAGLPMATGAAG